MQNNIFFFQSTSIGGNNNTPGLYEILLSHMDNLELKLFDTLQIIVPSLAIASWLKDQITIKHGICANVDCVVLPGPVLDNIYYASNPGFKPFNFSEAKYIIYDYLCHSKLDDEELNAYLYTNNKLDKLRAYQLASQLQQIFHEYIYLRTDDLINLDQSAIKSWQKEIIKYLFIKIGVAKTFLDVYKYLMSTDLDMIKLPDNLMIFGLTSIYPSQLQLLGRLSMRANIYWYYQTSSYQYYGDLLSDKAKSKLEKKLLKKPELNLEDLYLQDGNPLLANLAQQSREFTELLIANDIDVYTLNEQSVSGVNTILQQIQEDIRNIQYRIEPDYRFGSNKEIYANPITLANDQDNLIYDLPNNQTSIKINSCHNRMREVQVMFNEILSVLNSNLGAGLNDVLITAPDIDDYAPYIAAVFDNEMVGNEKLFYNITGNRKYKNYKILETFKILLNAPYILTANYLIEVLIQSEIQDSLDISKADVELVRKWLYDNKTHFGYDEHDYVVLGYRDYQIHSFKQFMNNIVLGSCISDSVYDGSIPLYLGGDKKQYIPYDNLDNNQVELCNKLILLINQLEELRNKFYIDSTNYSELTISEVHNILTNLHENCLHDKDSINNIQRFLGGLLAIPQDMIITLPILNQMLNEYIDDFKSNFLLNGNIICASMRFMRNIPFKYIYVLGLNFGEYPISYMPNQLSLLAQDWYLADRNYNVEDKQSFLDVLLACKEQLYLSYVGRRETDNSEIKPSPLLGLLINTLGQSFTNFTLKTHSDNITEIAIKKYDFKNLIVQQALHPFYNNQQPNYSLLWFKIANGQTDFLANAWDFSKISPIEADLSAFYTLKIENIVKVFLYTNTNLYNVLGINQFNHELELSDTENINLADRALAIQVEKCFKKYPVLDTNAISQVKQLEEYLIASGILAYEHIGHMQFNYYYDLYSKYCALRGIKAMVTLNYIINENITLNITDEVYIDDQTVIVTDNFSNIFSDRLADKLEDLPYSLKIKGLLIYLLCFGGGVVTLANVPQTIDKVVIRQIATTGDYHDLTLRVNDIPSVLNRMLRYYVRSLSNPVLIHKGAIQEYAKLVKMNKPHNACVDGSRAKYIADYENYDLDKIKEDRIFSSIATNYFEFMQNINGVNDVVKIGEILANLCI